MSATSTNISTESLGLRQDSGNEFASTTELGRAHGLPSVDLSAFDGSVLRAFRRLSPELQVKCQSLPVLPLALKEGEVALAIADPAQQSRVREVMREELGEQAKLVLATPRSFDSYLRQFRPSSIGEQPKQAPESRISGRQSTDVSPLPATSDTLLGTSESDAPVVRLVNRILGKAIASKASDVHFEPFEESYRVRMRRDGVLATCETPAISLAPAISARIKVMARMDISERRLPQDGRIRLALSDVKQVDLRVNSVPTLWGEKLVLRILGGSSEARALEEIGMSPHQQAIYEKALQKPQGLILVTGPTGSGKTVTLYAGLKRLNNDERNILAVEDPVEITLPGVNQVQVNSRIGLSFAKVLRAFLRQDPDVIMLGEIRDQETAEIAVRAAQTGHIVLATLHTNSAMETPGRLIDMGIPPFLLGSALSLVVAQRLVRRLCSNCAQPGEDGMESSSSGCEACLGGYSGRHGVYEMLEITPIMAEAISGQASLAECERIARSEGLSSLREEGMKLVAQGVTSLSEIGRVCS